jgi:acetyl-CoA synthetase
MTTYISRYSPISHHSLASFIIKGDGAYRDADGYYWIRGRVDDVINVSGHRLSTAEIESALVAHRMCAEAAVVGVSDDLTGQAIFAYCLMKAGVQVDEGVKKELVLQVRRVIGPFASPKCVLLVQDLPKVRTRLCLILIHI